MKATLAYVRSGLAGKVTAQLWLDRQVAESGQQVLQKHDVAESDIGLPIAMLERLYPFTLGGDEAKKGTEGK